MPMLPLTARQKALLNQIDQHLQVRPGDVPLLLEHISAHLTRFREDCKKQQDRHANMAIHLFMGRPPSRKLTRCIDAAYYRWPLGYDDSKVSLTEREWWEQFLKVAAQPMADRDSWLRCKGPDVYDWWYSYVEPLLDKDAPNTVG